MSDIVETYLQFLIKQYYEKPKANAEIRLMLSHWQDIADFGREFINCLDIDTAEAEILDLIGRIVGLSRQVNDVVPVSYFGFSNNENAKGFADYNDDMRESATFLRYGQSGYTPYQLQDSEYRSFLKIKIAKNSCSPFLVSDEKTSLQQVIFDAFDGKAYVVDNKNQTLTIYVSSLVDDTLLRLILNTDILPRPATFSYSVVVQAEVGETFGFSSNQNSKGFADYNDPSRDGGYFARYYNG